MRPAHHLLLWLCLSSGLVAASHARLNAQMAVAPASQKGDFHRTSWDSEEGLGVVFDVQQSKDAFLWLTTSRGVLRFDGVKFESIEDVTNGAIRNGDVISVMVGRGDYIWLTTRADGLLVWKDHTVTAFPLDRRCISVALTNGMAEDVDGSLWVRGLSGLYHVRGSSCDLVAPERGYPGGFPAAVFVDRQGTVWVKAPSGALVSRSSGASEFRFRRFVSGPGPNPAFLGEDPDGALWISDERGVRPVELETEAPRSPSTAPPSTPTTPAGDFAFGRDGSLWLATSTGIVRLDRQQWSRHGIVDPRSGDHVTRGAGLTSEVVWRLLIAREGEVWIASGSGLEQLRRTTLKRAALPTAAESQYAIAAGAHDSVWVGNANTPLTHVRSDGTIRTFPLIGHVSCIRRDRHGDVWVGGDRLFRIRETPEPTFVEMHFPDEQVARIVAIALDRNDDPWITLRPGQTWRLVAGAWRLENDALGKTTGIVGDMMTDEAGDLWFTFSNTLARWDGKAFQKYSFPRGPLDVSAATMAFRHGRIWLAGRGGVVMFTNGQFRPMAFQDARMPGRITGIVETGKGELWMNGASGIHRVTADALTTYLRQPHSTVRAELFDAQDGLPGLSAERFPVPSMVQTADERLWFATTKGIASLDALSVDQRRNPVPPPVQVKAIVANGVSYAATSGLTLPQNTAAIQIDYTALSLAIPKRVRFRYRLDGVDKNWQEAGSRRQTFYTNLGPGRYRFEVVACNSDGVWNDAGAGVDFTIPPTFLQSSWFTALWVTGLATVLLSAYRFRLARVTGQLRARMHERVAERERIARDLHDTFFQSIQGLLLRFHTATSRLQPDDPARPVLEEALRQSDEVMAEGRGLLVHLHGSTPIATDLAAALAALGRHLQGERSVRFDVAIAGELRALHPIVFEELSRIGNEALGNAFRHSRARSVEAELDYGSNELRMRIRDDGGGIESSILTKGGRAGHLGMASMRERAGNIGAQLGIWSRAGVGTEIEVRLPANLAYADHSGRRRRFWRRRWSTAAVDERGA